MEQLDVATAIIQQAEGCRLAPYQDLRGFWSIGFGNRCTIDGSTVTGDTQPLDVHQAQALLRETLITVTEPKLANLIKVSLNANQMGSLISLAYNIGTSAFGSSSLLRYLNLGQFTEASAQFDRWIFAGTRPVKGLVTRRALERGVFDGRVDPSKIAPFPLPGIPHPLFTSARTTELSTADILNAQELATLQPIPTGT